MLIAEEIIYMVSLVYLRLEISKSTVIPSLFNRFVT